LSKDKKLYDCNSETVKIMGASSKEEFLEHSFQKYLPQIQENGKNSIEFLENMLDVGREKGKID